MKRGVLILAGVIVSLIVFGVFVMAATQTSTASVTVNTFLSVSLTNAPVNFPNMNPGATENATVGSGFPLTATIGTESNTNGKVETKADAANFTGIAADLAVSNMRWSATVPPLPGGTNYTTTNAQVCASVAPGNACNIYHQLTIPGGQTAGAYSTGITITATAV